jgi:hypothetical protein
LNISIDEHHKSNPTSEEEELRLQNALSSSYSPSSNPDSPTSLSALTAANTSHYKRQGKKKRVNSQANMAMGAIASATAD